MQNRWKSWIFRAERVRGRRKGKKSAHRLQIAVDFRELRNISRYISLCKGFCSQFFLWEPSSSKNETVPQGAREDKLHETLPYVTARSVYKFIRSQSWLVHFHNCMYNTWLLI